jgi:hypothetical protein
MRQSVSIPYFWPWRHDCRSRKSRQGGHLRSARATSTPCRSCSRESVQSRASRRPRQPSTRFAPSGAYDALSWSNALKLSSSARSSALNDNILEPEPFALSDTERSDVFLEKLDDFFPCHGLASLSKANFSPCPWKLPLTSCICMESGWRLSSSVGFRQYRFPPRAVSHQLLQPSAHRRRISLLVDSRFGCALRR